MLEFAAVAAPPKVAPSPAKMLAVETVADAPLIVTPATVQVAADPLPPVG